MAPSPPPVSQPEKNKVVRPDTEKTLTSKKSHSRVIDSAPTSKHQDQAQTPKLVTRPASSVKVSVPSIKDSNLQVPLLSKKPKKNKPITKPVKVLKEEELHEEPFPPSTIDISRVAGFIADSSSTNSRSHSVERKHTPTSVQELLEKIDAITPGMDLVDNPFFDVQRLTSPAKMPLEYGPLVHALSALSVGGGSFANNMPSGSIDNAVSSFQQLLETLTQTISDLLRLLPRTTWDDSSSFDGVLRDMLKGDDFLDDGEEGPGKDDEVAALTLALERRARWMEVQLSKLEELHRDINTAAVRAILSFNDNGWDRHGFLPRIGDTLRRFDHIGMLEQNGEMQMMSADELEKKLAVAKEAADFAEMEIREAMEKSQISRSGRL
jgi:CCR4-NOT transcription complex subunit 4